jgi:hypothetical protein
MSFAIVGGWTLAVIGLLIGMYAAQYSAVWSSLILLTVAGSCAVMAFLTYCWYKDSQRIYELSIDGDEIELSFWDKRDGRKFEHRLALADVSLAEYFEPKDSASLLLRNRHKSLEIPLWTFGPHAEKTIVDYVRLSGVKIIGIPGDIVI